MSKKKIMAALALATLMGVAQARSAEILIEPDRVMLVAAGGGLSVDSVRQAIAKGGAKHGWAVSNDAPGKMTLKYNKQNKHEVVVDVSYDNTGFQIRYAGSSNMKYEQHGASAMIHPFYNKWVSNLSSAISVEAAGLRGGN